MMVYYIGFSGVKQVGSCEFFLNRAAPLGKPSPGRGWTGEAGTGVGRYKVGPGAAPLPPLRRHLPPGEGRGPSPGRGWQGGALTGVGRDARSDPVPPLFRRCGGTFPQGKVGDPLLGEGGPGKARDGCGTGRDRTRYRSSSAACGRHLPPGEGQGFFAVSFLVCSAFLSISAFKASRESNFRSGRRKWVRWREMVRS